MKYFLVKADLFHSNSLSRLENLLPRYNTDKIILCCANERYTVEQLDSAIHIVKKFDFKHLILLLDECLEEYNLQFDGVTIDYIPYCELKTYNRTFNAGHPHNTYYAYETKKALFLVGKPNRKNRIRLLYNFYKLHLMNKLVWSFHNHDFDLQPFLPSGLTDNEINKFISDTIRVADEIIFRGNGSMFYDGFPYDIKLYTNSALSIVSETECDDGHMTHRYTEKIYRAIVNNHPFVVAGDVNYLQGLRKKGYKTFDNYLLLDYDTILDVEERLERITLNVENFLNSLDDKTFIQSIQQDVNHNFCLLKKRMKKVNDLFYEKYELSSNLCTNFGL